MSKKSLSVIGIITLIISSGPAISVPDHQIKTQCFSVKNLIFSKGYYYSKTFQKFPCSVIHGSGSGMAHYDITANNRTFTYDYTSFNLKTTYRANNIANPNLYFSYFSRILQGGGWKIPTENIEEKQLQQNRVSLSGVYTCFVETQSKTAFCIDDER